MRRCDTADSPKGRQLGFILALQATDNNPPMSASILHPIGDLHKIRDILSGKIFLRFS
jgi:hypothetical protein